MKYEIHVRTNVRQEWESLRGTFQEFSSVREAAEAIIETLNILGFSAIRKSSYDDYAALELTTSEENVKLFIKIVGEE